MGAWGCVYVCVVCEFVLCFIGSLCVRVCVFCVCVANPQDASLSMCVLSGSSFWELILGVPPGKFRLGFLSGSSAWDVFL